MHVKKQTLPSAPRSAVEPHSHKVSPDVLIHGLQPIVPPPAGVYDISAPLNSKGYFTSKGIRQWNTGTAPTAGGVPTEMKARYDLLVRGEINAAENRAAGKREFTVQQQDSLLLGEQILRRAALREMETYDDLVQQGLTHEEATKIIRDQMIAKTLAGKGRSTRAYHQQLKEVVHQMAAERGVQVGLPQSLATFAGRHAPHTHFATTVIGAVKAALRQQIHDPAFNIQKSAADLNRERIAQESAGVRQVPDRNGLPPSVNEAPAPYYNRASLQEHARAIGINDGGASASIRAGIEAREASTSRLPPSAPVSSRTRSRS